MTWAEARAAIVELLEQAVGNASTFEARDEARTLLAKAYDEWAKKAEK